MKTKILAYICSLASFCYAVPLYAQTEPFIRTELNLKPGGSENYRLAHPFEILYGPDNYLYITEKVGRVLRVDTGTGVRKVILDLRASVALNITRNSGGVATGIGQNGMLGMALHPNFSQGTNQDSIFIAYSYTPTQVRISRFKFNDGPNPTLTGETVLISGLPASNDHTTGRLIVGGDGKLYYSCGDKGNNQFANRCSLILSQTDPTASQVSAQDYTNYSGKVLRLNLDGSIPSDNPLFNGVRSHVYTKGHRNPQGLVWEKAASNGFSFPTLVSNGKLFSSEQGPRTDDELNILEAGKNYGWPYIAGDSDNVNYQYINWSSASTYNCNHTSYTENAIPTGATITQEKDAPAALKANFRKPIMSMHTTCGTQTTATCNAGGTDWMKFATVAPASIDYYNINAGLSIPGWYPSLLIPTLRKGTLYRVKLNATGDAVESDTIPYFASYNRYRDIAMSPDGLKIFIVTDSVGSTSGPSGTGTSVLDNPGSILVYQYSGAILALTDKNLIKKNTRLKANVYPNPARNEIFVELEKGLHKPIAYQLYDVTGKAVMSGSSSNNSFSLSVGRLKRGLYILKLTDGYDRQVVLEKVVLQ